MCDFAAEDLMPSDGCHTGGMKVKAWWAYYIDVEIFPSPPAVPTNFTESVTIATPLVMKAGKFFKTMEGDLEMISLNSESAGGMNSLSAVNKYKCRLSGTSRQLVGFLNSSKNKNLALVVEDSDGNKRLLGKDGIPAKIEGFSEQSGEKIADAKFIEFTVYFPGTLPYFYDAAVPIAP